MADPRWKDGCKAMLTVTSIFAGLSGVMLVNILARSEDQFARNWRFYVGVGAILFSLYWFVWIAERLTDALEQGRPGTYVDAMYRFNLAVLSAFVSVSAFISGLDSRSILDKGLPNVSFGDLAAIAILFAVFTRGPWLQDAIFLHDRRAKGINNEGQLVEITDDDQWNERIKPLLERE
jgi:hypothetical protein